MKKKYKKEYYAKNKLEILAKRKLHYKDNKDAYIKRGKVRRSVINYEIASNSNNKWLFIARRLFDSCKHRAKKNCIPFDIAVDDLVIPEICPVLGIELSFSNGVVADNSPSIDRMIPEKGYTKGNIFIISYKANRIKSNASVDEVQKVLNYMKERTI